VSPTAGYSGTPLPQKLGIKAGHAVGLDGSPSGFEKTLGVLPEGARLSPARRGKAFDVLLLFVRDRKALEAKIEKTIARMAADTALWICWPKKTSPLASDVNENDVRALGLAAGVVDVKICAVDEDWSGLKFVYRLKDRPKIAARRARGQSP
jgi:hypothetical protein